MKIGFTYLDLWYFLDDTDWVKGNLLYFDNILVDYGRISLIEKMIAPFHRAPDLLKKKLGEIETLEKKGLVSIFDKKSFTIPGEYFSDANVSQNIRLHIKQYDKFTKRDTTQSFKDVYLEFMEDDRAGGQYGIRYKSAILNKIESESEFIPIIKKFYANPTDLEVKKENVLRLILKRFPVVSDDISLEKIMDIKSDSDMRTRYYALRDFIANISKSNLSLKEIEDKIEFLFDQYTKRLELHRLKYTSSTLEIICITTAQFVENIIKLKFSDALKLFFDLNMKKIEIIEAEKNILGRELSYIHKIQDRL